MKAISYPFIFALTICLLINCNMVSPTAQKPKEIQGIISIRFDQPSCTFTLNQASLGIQIPYQILIAENVDTIYAMQLATCTQPDSSGLIPLEGLYGNDQEYCKRDNGFCLYSLDGYLSKLRAGIYPYLFQWTGRNWYGRSDTGNPLGDPFPVGDYIFKVSIKGRSKVNNSYKEFNIQDSINVHLAE